jgi:hypothetical protein
MIKTIQGRVCRLVGRRWLAIPKPASLTDRIALSTTDGLRTSWQRIMESPVGGHVICNQKRADSRRGSMWNRKVIPVRFAGRR